MKDKKLRQCTYPNCDKEQYVLIKKMCNYHYAKSRPQKIYKYIPKQTKRNILKNKEKSILMKPYWEYHLSILSNGKNCENCNIEIQSNIISIAHILPKQYHKDVCNNLLNCIYLCGLCHSKYDQIQTTDNIYEMKVFLIALERYIQFKDDVVIYSKYKKVFDDWIIKNNICQLN